MKCARPDCEEKAVRHQWCIRHYKREVYVRTRDDVEKDVPCGCGCGGMTWFGFVLGHNARLIPREEQARRGRMNDGSKQRGRGSGTGYRKVRGRHEHRIVAEQKLGRPLRKGEIVHHIDENKQNNHPDNLEVMTQSEHMRLHLHGGRRGH